MKNLSSAAPPGRRAAQATEQPSRGACGGVNATVLNRRGAAGVNARPTVPGNPRGQPKTRVAARFRGWDESHPYGQ